MDGPKHEEFARSGCHNVRLEAGCERMDGLESLRTDTRCAEGEMERC